MNCLAHPGAIRGGSSNPWVFELSLDCTPDRRRRFWLQWLWFSFPTDISSDAVLTDDQTDIQAALGGDGQAYRRLVDRYQRDVAAWMWRFTRDHNEWEALVQDVFVEAFFALKNYRGQGPFPAWLRTIATRTGYRFWKQRKRMIQQESWSLQDWDQVCGGDDAAKMSAEDAAGRVHEMLSRMAPRDRLVLTLYYLDGCSIADIAQQVGWTKTMVKVQMHRARKRLRKLVDPAAS